MEGLMIEKWYRVTTCAVCGRVFQYRQRLPAHIVDRSGVQIIKPAGDYWIEAWHGMDEDGICQGCGTQTPDIEETSALWTWTGSCFLPCTWNDGKWTLKREIIKNGTRSATESA